MVVAFICRSLAHLQLITNRLLQYKNPGLHSTRHQIIRVYHPVWLISTLGPCNLQSASVRFEPDSPTTLLPVWSGSFGQPLL